MGAYIVDVRYTSYRQNSSVKLWCNTSSHTMAI